MIAVILEFGDGLMGMGKGLLDSLIAEGGVKSRDLRKLGIYIGMDIEIRRGRSDRNAAKFYGYPYFTFYLEEIFCAYLFPFFFFVIRKLIIFKN